jgi:hypothetical protein
MFVLVIKVDSGMITVSVAVINYCHGKRSRDARGHMNWSTKKPIVAGWYWYRGEHDEPKCVEFVKSDTLGILFNDSRLPRDLDCWPGEYAGPITMPKGTVVTHRGGRV